MTKLVNSHKKLWWIRVFFYSAILLSLLFCLSSCTAVNKVVSDDEIKSDLLSSLMEGIVTVKDDDDCLSQISSNYEYKFSDFEIEKRQTSAENKTDTIYVNATLSSTDEVIKYSGNFVINYSLYNDGWKLDEISVESLEYAPLQSTEFTIEQLANALESCDYKNATNINVTNHKDDLENGFIYYYLTATCEYTYVTEYIDVDMTFYFCEDGWSSSNVYISEINASESNWHIAGKFCNPNSTDDLILGVDGSVDTLSIEYTDRYKDHRKTISENHIYRIDDTSLNKAIGDFFEEVNRLDAEYITHYDFSIIMRGDCTDYNSFEYVAWWAGGGNRFDGMLFIGRDKLGFMWSHDDEIDIYNHRVVVDITELIPME